MTGGDHVDIMVNMWQQETQEARVLRTNVMLHEGAHGTSHPGSLCNTHVGGIFAGTQDDKVRHSEWASHVDKVFQDVVLRFLQEVTRVAQVA